MYRAEIYTIFVKFINFTFGTYFVIILYPILYYIVLAVSLSSMWRANATFVHKVNKITPNTIRQRTIKPLCWNVLDYFIHLKKNKLS